MSIFDYLRESRLKRAALAIEKKGHSIAYAAAIAGYSSAANFSTAFRKYFGISPKALKSR
jgi:AraC-like DNA-binding protein